MSKKGEPAAVERCSPDEWDRIQKMTDPDEFLAAAREYWRRLYVTGYGQEILDLSTSDEALLAAIKSGEPRRQKMAFCSLEHIRDVFNATFVDSSVDLLLFGADTEVRLSAMNYLAIHALKREDAELITLLEDCLARLESFGAGRDAAVVAKCIRNSLDSVNRWRQGW
jgi:hypothetical protein